MKALKIFFGFSLVAFLTACPGGGSGGGGENGSLGVRGTLSIVGQDTNNITETLEVAEVRSVPQTESLPDHALIGSQGTTAEVSDPNNIPDINNLFLIVVNQNFPSGPFNSAISMTIRFDGVEYSYICHNPIATHADCGTGLSLDLANNRVTFNDVDVENSDNGNNLRINGVVNW